MEKLLVDLDARFNPKGTTDRVIFDCPIDNNHCIEIALNKSIPELNEGKFWKSTGNTLETLTCIPSINCTQNKDGTISGCHFHGWIRDGKVVW